MCKFYKITEYLGILFGAFLFGIMFFNWILSGEIIKTIIGFIMLLILIGSLFIITIREILYWAGDHTKKCTKKDNQ